MELWSCKIRRSISQRQRDKSLLARRAERYLHRTLHADVASGSDSDSAHFIKMMVDLNILVYNAPCTHCSFGNIVRSIRVSFPARWSLSYHVPNLGDFAGVFSVRFPCGSDMWIDYSPWVEEKEFGSRGRQGPRQANCTTICRAYIVPHKSYSRTPYMLLRIAIWIFRNEK